MAKHFSTKIHRKKFPTETDAIACDDMEDPAVPINEGGSGSDMGSPDVSDNEC